MIVKSEFKADLFQLKHCAAPDVLINELKDRAAIDMGRGLSKIFPFQKDDDLSFKGAVPAMSLNRDHEFTDHYRSEFFAMSIEDFRSLKIALENIVVLNPQNSYLLSLINQ